MAVSDAVIPWAFRDREIEVSESRAPLQPADKIFSGSLLCKACNSNGRNSAVCSRNSPSFSMPFCRVVEASCSLVQWSKTSFSCCLRISGSRDLFFMIMEITTGSRQRHFACNNADSRHNTTLARCFRPKNVPQQPVFRNPVFPSIGFDPQFPLAKENEYIYGQPNGYLHRAGPTKPMAIVMKIKSLPCWLALFCATAIAAQADPILFRDQLASANTGFAFKLLGEINRAQPDTNIFISPYSVSSVLQMVGNGAGGKTRDELQHVLGLSSIASNFQNQACLDLDRLIHGQNTNSILNSANALWYRQGFPVKPAFIACNQQYFQATVTGLDFNNPASPEIINGWVNEKTHGRIPSIISGPIDGAIQMYLINAVYFKGKWLEPFEVKATKERPFICRAVVKKTCR